MRDKKNEFKTLDTFLEAEKKFFREEKEQKEKGKKESGKDDDEQEGEKTREMKRKCLELKLQKRNLEKRIARLEAREGNGSEGMISASNQELSRINDAVKEMNKIREEEMD